MCDMAAASSVPMPMALSTAEKICDACVRAVGTVKGTIRAQDPLSKFGIEDGDGIEDLVDKIVNDEDIGVPSEKYKIPDANKLQLKGSTTFAQLAGAVVANSEPDSSSSLQQASVEDPS
jgi:hypothetical protein